MTEGMKRELEARYEKLNLQGVCKQLVDAIDTPRVSMYQALEHLESTGDYKWGKTYLENRLELGKRVSRESAARLRVLGGHLEVVGERFTAFFDQMVIPLIKGLIDLYDKNAEIGKIEEETSEIDIRLYEWMFDKFKDCIGC